MFPGGFGVGLTVTDLAPLPPEFGPSVMSSPSLGEMLPVYARTAAEKAAELQRVQELKASLAAYELELVRPSPPTARPPWTAGPVSPAPRLPGTTRCAGVPITAVHVRDLLVQLDAVGLQAPPGGSLRVSFTDERGALHAVATLRELRLAAKRGCAEHPVGNCGCPVITRPAATDAYTPTAAQDRFLLTRDRTCRHPGCSNRAGWADADHVVPYAQGGATDCANLCCLCRRHHRLKTFAPGWIYAMTPDGIPHRHHTRRRHPHQPTTGPAAHRTSRPHPTSHRPRPIPPTTHHRSDPSEPRCDDPRHDGVGGATARSTE